MAIKRIVTPNRFVGLSSDTKPTSSTEPRVRPGDTFFEYNTGDLYITYDGTSWSLKEASGAYTTPTHTAPSIGATTTVVLAANASRLNALLVNDSDEVIYIKLGADAVMNQGIRINASGGDYAMSRELGNLFTGAINGICASGSKVLLVTEGT